jgi:hypothetical protein
VILEGSIFDVDSVCRILDNRIKTLGVIHYSQVYYLS